MIMKTNKALTLIEIMIVILLFSVLLTAIFSVLATARSSWKSGSSKLTVQQEARRGMSSIVKELRQAVLSGIDGVPPDGSYYTSVTFQIPVSISESGVVWSNNIQYSLGGLDNTQIIRTQDGNQRVAANNISALTFNRAVSTPDIINVSITAQKNTFPGFSAIQSSITLTSGIAIRND